MSDRVPLAVFAAALAAATAPMVAALGYGAIVYGIDPIQIGNALGFWTFSLLVAVLHLFIAIPIYLLMRRTGWVNWGTSALGGFVIGTLPAMLLAVRGGDGILNGATIFFLAWLGLSGLTGGLTFRAVLGKPA